MRSLILVAGLFSLLLPACGMPEVEAPAGNENLTSDPDKDKDDVAPTVNPPVPSKYPYRTLIVRGIAGSEATRVIVGGAGNAVGANVEPRYGTFCVAVDLPSMPAQYTLKIQSQGPDGKLSKATEVTVNRATDAPAPTDSKSCDGSIISN